eukprot:TRINITY_DN11563_c0_g1_i1.p1 TRINITY_DN11563_c0_g1~~TRINITY_DN11563_c0_g1_i1.p1  ORF type:complete len:331 (+),score=67.76 TRINITY_DN11563_c0_g1_i1:87-1079(+)
MQRVIRDTISTIDCRYMNKTKYAASYMLNRNKEVAFVDNNTNDSVPILLTTLRNQNLSVEEVKYIIITHIHLDHAGGTSTLAKMCPNAKVLAHPRAVPHLINPKMIIAGASAVYGEEEFNKIYGKIEAVHPEKVLSIADGTKLPLGGSELEFIHTRGHAKHHMVIYDHATESIFTGDAFGVSYFPLFKEMGSRKGILFPSSSPIDFEPLEAHKSVDKIVATGAKCAFPTHFGVWEDIPAGATLLHEGITCFEEILCETKQKLKNDFDEKHLQAWGEDEQIKFFTKILENDGINFSENRDKILEILKMDIQLNAAGIIVAAKRELRQESKL